MKCSQHNEYNKQQQQCNVHLKSNDGCEEEIERSLQDSSNNLSLQRHPAPVPQQHSCYPDDDHQEVVTSQCLSSEAVKVSMSLTLYIDASDVNLVSGCGAVNMSNNVQLAL